MEAKKQSLQKAGTNSVSNRPGATTKNLIQAMLPEIKKALPNTLTPERFTRLATTALSSNKKLQECTSLSFIGAMMNAAQLGMEPNTPLGEAYLIPFNNHGTMEVQFQLGYKGLLKLAQNAGVIVDAHEVYANDDFSYSYGLHPDLQHTPALSNRGEVIAYYAIWRRGNEFGFDVMSKEDVERHAKKYSNAYTSGYTSPWKTDFDAMAKKTVIKQTLKYAPLSTDLIRQIETDNTIKSTIDPHMDEQADETAWDVLDAETSDERSEDQQAAPEPDPDTGEVKE